MIKIIKKVYCGILTFKDTHIREQFGKPVFQNSEGWIRCSATGTNENKTLEFIKKYWKK